MLSLALLKKTLKQTLMRWKLLNRRQHQIVMIPTLKPQVYSPTSHWCLDRLRECGQTWVRETMNFVDFRIPMDIMKKNCQYKINVLKGFLCISLTDIAWAYKKLGIILENKVCTSNLKSIIKVVPLIL